MGRTVSDLISGLLIGLDVGIKTGVSGIGRYRASFVTVLLALGTSNILKRWKNTLENWMPANGSSCGVEFRSLI